MAPQAPTVVPSLGMTLGSVYIGAIIAAILFGITNLQAVIYYKKYPDDWWIYQYSVNALHVALGTHALYHYFVDSFGDYTALYDIIWYLQILFNYPLNATNRVLTTPIFRVYAVRIWKLGRHFHKILPWFVVLDVVVAWDFLTYMPFDRYLISSFLSVPSIKISICTVFSMAAISDFIIAFSMCYYLRKGLEGTTFSSTSAMILSLMRLIVISWIGYEYLAGPDSLVFLGIDFILPKCQDYHASSNNRDSTTKVLRFASHNSGADTEELNISTPMPSPVQSLERDKEHPDSRV
ncbi:uncharacterized protein EV420DRAFT_1572081 [Desarmillaria tabescens]|uniref:Uncharacterized protein n=1 Tax=Armillaria tabescens TaxID=1929756 RepID=A0AA39MTI0_ARMTA|nr:uncharacterized protein EV420DRAFT_1572081 [Desarmillaria tabescens]KAK0445653.1 hypothetical protein EV420DRAFT_1572081 [Desarmillaria tabescens]